MESADYGAYAVLVNVRFPPLKKLPSNVADGFHGCVKNKAEPTTPSPDPDHLDWLIESRRTNQEVCLRLYRLLKCKKWEEDGALGYAGKSLASIGFSLWRAAPLASNSTDQKMKNEHTIWFLGEILETNAIAFTQDKKANRFTCSYYLVNARLRIREYCADSETGFHVQSSVLQIPKREAKTTDLWDDYQEAFESAVGDFEQRLMKFKNESRCGAPKS